MVINFSQDELNTTRFWVIVPIISFGGIVISILSQTIVFLSSAGIWGCIIGSCFLAYLAYIKPKKDIVSLLTPLYAVIIFSNPDFSREILTQILFAASLFILVIRLNLRFSTKDSRENKKMNEEYEGEVTDEELPS